MKKITLLAVFLVSMAGFSQTNKQKIQNYFENNLSKYALTGQDVSDLVIESELVGTGTKITSSFVVQRYQGTEIFNAQSNVSLKNGDIINVSNNFVKNIAQKVNATVPVLSVTDAAASAYNKVGVIASPNFSVAETRNSKSFLLNDGIQEDPISAKLVYQKTDSDKLLLAWALQFYTPDGKHLWDLRIDALNGKVLEKHDLTLTCSFGDANHNQHNHTDFSFTKSAFNKAEFSVAAVNPGSYRVIPYSTESPKHGPFELITTTGNALASPYGWHDTNGVEGAEYTFTRGNNVLAQEDADGNNGNGLRPEGGESLNFDFAYSGESALPTAYTNAATTNLFYMVNTIHDIWYQYGWDEASGNFQQNNYGRGGVVSGTGDYVLADAQDGYSQTTPTLNNANFSTPNDGIRPRVQMFLWNAGAPPTNFITVNTPSTIAGEYAATTNVFETTDAIPVPVAPNGITSDLVLYTNAANAAGNNPVTVNNGCVPPTNAFDISGKIALIRRGNCNFSNKVKNAQDAGATAVIVYDTVPNNPLRLSMSSEGLLGINIPAVFVTKEIGESFIAAMATGPVNLKLEVPANLYLYADGDFDNVVIGHEVGHGISNKLIGGNVNSSCMTNFEQMGEGWSDWFGLMLQIKAGDTGADSKYIGAYVYNQDITVGPGLREFPYSTDMSINPRTLASSNAPVDANNAYRYVLGETWATVLWDLTWAYIDKYGFDANIYEGTGGNNKVMQLVIDALKLQACNTASMVSSRDNIIAADFATTGGADYCLITEVFARRGYGLNASSGNVNDPNDQVEDFTPFPAGPNCTLAVNYFESNDSFKVYPNPSNGTFNVRINKFSGKVNLQVIDVNGRAVYNSNEDFNVEKTINLNNLQSGMYILKVSGSDVNYTEKIIIK